MSITNLSIIPDINDINESLRISEQFNSSFEYNDFFMPSLLDDKASLNARIKAYKSLGRKNSHDTLHGVFFDICVNSVDSRIKSISIERMKHSVEIAHELGCSGVIFHTNTIPGFETDFYIKGWVDNYTEFYSKLCDENKDINIYVENMFDFHPYTLKQLAVNMQNISNWGVCYDVAHSHIHDLPTKEWIQELKPYIKHLHINDNDGKKDLHLAVGDGSLDWFDFFKLLNDNNINSSMLIEVNGAYKQEQSFNYLKEHQFIE